MSNANYMNPVKPLPCEILEVRQESGHEYTFRVASDITPEHGQFLQLSIPKVGEAPISVSGFGKGWLDFTIRAVGKVTDAIFAKKAGDILFLRGPYGKGWPLEQFKNKHLVVIAGGTGVAPVRSMLNYLTEHPDYVKGVHLIAGFKDENCILFQEDLDCWKQHFETTYTLDKKAACGCKAGMVTDYVPDIPFLDFGEDYAVVIVGPPNMMKYAGLAVVDQGVPEDKIWLSFERKMSCAVGKCGHCRIDETYVCLEGPVFNYTQAKYLVD